MLDGHRSAVAGAPQDAQRGAVAFLQKPFEVGELDAVLNLMACPASSSMAHDVRLIRMALLDDIVASDLLIPFFQPIVALDGPMRHLGYEALARHRSDKACASCHARFDSMGLVFEGYGPIGERRTKDLGDRPVDDSATFPGGSNVVDAVVRTLRQKLGTAGPVVEAVRGSGYRFDPPVAR